MTRERSPVSAEYHKLSIQQKQALSLSSVRERPVACPSCHTQVMPTDLLKHMGERCQGRREPGPGAKWVTWREALGMGVNRQTLSRWAQTGHVRFVGERQDRKYLLEDLAMKIAHRNGFSRR